MRQLAKYVLVGSVASIVASLLAVSVYGAIEWRDSLFAFDTSAVLLFGLPVAIRGLILAIPTAFVLFLLRTRLSKLSFVALATVASALVGLVLGLLLNVNSDHISPAAVVGALACTWGVAGFVVSLFKPASA